jgi:hypothetical protein
MRRLLLAGAFAVSGLAALGSVMPLGARAIAPPVQPGAERAAQAAVIIVGRVVALEDKDMQVGGQTYRIAAVSVTEAIKGTKEKQVRVGFVPVQGGAEDQPIRPGRRPFGNPQFTVGQDGLFFLSKGPEDKFFVTPGFGTFVSSEAGNFKDEVGQAKAAVAVGENPMKFLKSEKAEERLFAASMLIQKYRQPRNNAKMEKVDAEESKLILAALAKADWNAPQRGQNHPWQLFNQLGLTADDGWDLRKLGEVRDVREYYKAAQTWLEKNGDSYRIQKFVGGEPINRPRPPRGDIDLPIRIQPLPIEVDPAPPAPDLPRVRPGIRIQPAQPAPEPVPDVPQR